VGAAGHFGWLDYTFPGWVYSDAQYVLHALLALALTALVRARTAISVVLPIFACFAVMGSGCSERSATRVRYRLSIGYPFEQARCLFPLLALYGTFIVLAARGGGRRSGPVLVLSAMAHRLFAETLTISCYYG
jgi:hypothetical protein